MTIEIAKAKEHDIDKIEELYYDVCDYLADKEYNPGWRKGCFPTGTEARLFLQQEGLYVAWAEGKVVGSIALTYNPSAEAEDNVLENVECKDILFVHVIAVHPNYLRQGIATQMLKFAEKQGRQRNVKYMRLYVWENNSVAIETYERNGYIAVGKADIGLGEYGMDWFCLYEKNL